ncbi:MAG: CDP-diacylglycerol--serine O-phosphatidyltransferase [bacterium]|nr:CDP-diacylglycerol--serine O-phosphatidyltransferase [bacterium]
MSKLRSAIPSFFTLGNLFFGFFSIVSSFHGLYTQAAWLIVIAGVFDAVDGKVARWVNSASEFGAELDSLCDIVSFGLAPSMLVYVYAFSAVPLPFDLPIAVGVFLAFLPSLGGAIRLARFNVMSRGKTEHKNYFVGLPIPASAATIATFIVFTHSVYGIDYAPKALVFLLPMLAFLMVSKVKYHALPQLTFKQSPKGQAQFLFVIFCVVAMAVAPVKTAFPLILLYLSYGILRAVFGLFVHPKAVAH